MLIAEKPPEASTGTLAELSASWVKKGGSPLVRSVIFRHKIEPCMVNLYSHGYCKRVIHGRMEKQYTQGLGWWESLGAAAAVNDYSPSPFHILSGTGQR